MQFRVGVLASALRRQSGKHQTRYEGLNVYANEVDSLATTCG